MSYDYSLVMIVPVEHHETVEQVGMVLGHSGREYSVPCAPVGQTVPTHFGLVTWARADYVLAVTGTLPDRDPTPEEEARAQEILAPLGGQEAALRALLITNAVKGGQQVAHFDGVCAANGLARIIPAID